MFKTIRNVFKIQGLRKKIIYTLMMLIVVRFGCQPPIPGVETTFFADQFIKQATDVFDSFNAMTGGSFSSISTLVSSITPYITSSIIIRLLAIAIPKLEELQKDGEDSRKKIQEYTRYTTVVLVLIESSTMAIGLGRQGLLLDYNAWNTIITVVITTTGSALLMWIGEQITEKDVGNGTSIVLLFNILSSVPNDVGSLYYRLIFGQTVSTAAIAILVIALVILAMVVLVIVLNDVERRIPIQYSKKMVGRKMVDGQASNIPLRINTAGVMPVIFIPPIMSFLVAIPQLFTVDYNSIGGKISMVLNSGSWYRPESPEYSIGPVIYIVLLVMFVYFYTFTTFNPLEAANNMKKQGGFIPGIRPGKPVGDYLNKILNYIVFIGAYGLVIIAVVPVLASGLLNVSHISFSGTSLIIIVGVVLETIEAVESQMLVRYYKGLLND